MTKVSHSIENINKEVGVIKTIGKSGVKQYNKKIHGKHLIVNWICQKKKNQWIWRLINIDYIIWKREIKNKH